MTDKLARHRGSLASLTVVLAVAHAVMAILHLVRRAAPAILPDGLPAWLDSIVRGADNHFWIVAHLAAGAALATAGIARRIPLSLACYLSSTVWVSWCALTLIWSLHTYPPVSLAGPVMVAILTVPTSQIVASAWVEREMMPGPER